MPYYKPSLAVMRKTLRRLPRLALLMVSIGPGIVCAQQLDTLSDVEKVDVESICLPVQFQSGAEAYRECITSQISNRTQSSAAPTPELSFAEQYAIQQFCQSEGPLGSIDHNDCKTAQLTSIQNVPAPELNQLGEDERHAVQQDCVYLQNTGGAKAYRQCLNSTVSALKAIPEPDLSSLNLADRNALQLDCTKPPANAVDYRSCLLDAVNGAKKSSETAATTSTDNNSDTVPNIPVAEAEEAITVPLGDQGEPIAATPTLAAPNTLAPVAALNQVAQTAATAQVQSEAQTAPEIIGQTDEPVITDPIAGQIIGAANTQELLTAADTTSNSEAPPPADTQSATGADTTVAANGNDLVNKIKLAIAELPTRFEGMLAGLNGVNRVILMAAIALPLLLIALWLMVRRREPELEYIAPAHPRPLVDRIGPSQQRRPTPQREHWTEEQSPVEDDTSNLSRQMDDLLAETVDNQRELPAHSADNLPIRDVATPTSYDASDVFAPPVNHDAPRPSQAVAETSKDDPMDNAASNDSAHGDILHNLEGSDQLDAQATTERYFSSRHLPWLTDKHPDDQLSLAIEFLVYWMAYGDERYEPELKKKVFSLAEPNEHDLIKRHVLLADAHSFKGTINWIQFNTSGEQRLQILNLLLALLVNEHAITPVQNTLLRFLGDAFGLGHVKLDNLYVQAFNHPMPQFARVDKPNWWDLQDVDGPKRWDARSVARQPHDIQYRVKLGLPLSGKLEESAIINSFARAEARCAPQAFSQLTDRERILAQRQLEKFEQAKNALLEVIA